MILNQRNEVKLLCFAAGIASITACALFFFETKIFFNLFIKFITIVILIVLFLAPLVILFLNRAEKFKEIFNTPPPDLKIPQKERQRGYKLFLLPVIRRLAKTSYDSIAAEERAELWSNGTEDISSTGTIYKRAAKTQKAFQDAISLLQYYGFPVGEGNAQYLESAIDPRLRGEEITAF